MRRRTFVTSAIAAGLVGSARADQIPQQNFGSGAYTTNTFRTQRLGMQPLQVGGISLETVGPVGTIYEGFVLSCGDDYDGPLSVYHPTRNPDGLWLGDKANVPNLASSGPESKPSIGGYLANPWSTGNNDANRGVVVSTWSDILVQSGGVLSMKARGALDSERLMTDTNQAALVAWLSSGIYLQHQPPCIIEVWARITGQLVTSNNSAGVAIEVGPVWTDQVGPFAKGNNWEKNFDGLISSPGVAPTSYDWNDTGVPFGVTPTAHAAAALTTVCDGYFHKWTMYQDWTKTIFLVDDKFAGELDLPYDSHGHRPQEWLESLSIAAGTPAIYWNNTRMDLGWTRVWRKATARHYFPNPAFLPVDIFIPFGGSFSLTLPTTDQLWGDSSIDHVVSIVPTSSRAPCFDRNGKPYGLAFPPPLAYDAGTRVLSGGPIVDQAGQILAAVSVQADGSTCNVARAKINVGITDTHPGTVNVTIGQLLINDLYSDFDCGDTGPPNFSNLTGLPAGLTFNTVGPNAGQITGTPTGTGTLTGTATDGLGQSVSFSRIYAVPTPGSGTPLPLFPAYADLTAQGIIGSIDPDKASSLTFSSGAFGTGGKVSAIAGADGTASAAVQATSGFQPTSVIVNNRGALQFDGLSQFLNWDALAAAFPNAFGTDANSSFTLIAVFSLVSIRSPFQVVIDVGHAAAAANVQRAYLSANTTQLSFTSGGGAFGVANDGPAGTVSVDTGVHFLAGRCFPNIGANVAALNVNRDRQPNGGILGSTPGIISGTTPNPITTVTIGALHSVAGFSNFANMNLLRLVVIGSTPEQKGVADIEKNRYASWSSGEFGSP